MGHVLSLIKQEGFQCLPCDRVNLDIERYAEYRDSGEHPAEAVFERPEPDYARRKLTEVGGSSIFQFFLDGSRRTYKVADIILDGHYLPLVAGQVGVAVVRRRNDGVGFEPVREYCHFENVLAFPDRANQDDLKHLEEKINENVSSRFSLLRYEVKPDRDPVDLGVAKIMSRMHDMEVRAVQEMADKNELRNDSLLIIDGPLRFKKKFDLVQFRNVIGLSKSFRPSFTIGTGKKKADVGSITSGLGFAERTPVYRTTEEEKTIGMWYLRLRDPARMMNPLQGIVKMECYAVDPQDAEDGFDAERIDILSAYMLRERNVTPFKADSRWASHIYPVYTAEKYIKNSFISDTYFKALF